MMNRLQSHMAWIWGFSIVGVWVFLATKLDQSILQTQISRDLAIYGAFKGRDLSLENAWRLLASQWLHVKFPHMMFNAVVIGLLGTALHKRTGAAFVLLVGLGGGALGQYSSALAYPSAFISGASQAYLALAGATILLADRKQAAWWIAIFGVSVAVALDVFLSSHGTIKIGHSTAFAAGLIGAAILLAFDPAGAKPMPS